MKRERYFQNELRRLFVSYAIVPALAFTLVCGLIFSAAFLYGKYRTTRRQNRYVTEQLERVLRGYEAGLEQLQAVPGLFDGETGKQAEKRRQLYEIVYSLRSETGYEADFYVLDRDGLVVEARAEASETQLEARPSETQLMARAPEKQPAVQPPEYLGRKQGCSWGMFPVMDQNPGQPVIRLCNGWSSQAGILAIGMQVPGGPAGASGSDEVSEASGSAGFPGGYLIFTISSRQMQPALEDLDTQTVVCDAFDWGYVSSGNQFLTESNQVRDLLKTAGRLLCEDGQFYLVEKAHAEPGGFTVYSISNIQNIVISLAISGLLVVTALLGMSAWLLIVSGRVTARKTEDFYQILDVLKQVKGGNLDTAISIQSNNEFQIIADACNEMMSGLKEQMENNQKMAVLVATAQNKQLESQFNPHFLYNTLENIRYMCKLEPATAERMVYNLSGLLRYSLNGSEAEVPLKEDLEHLENYLSILKYRFGERFCCEIDVAPEVMACRIPKLVFQPMIENAVKYGFGRQEKLKVELKAYLHEERLIMICRDDGVGMTPAQVSELTAMLEQKENTSRHSGLYNIHRRIVLLYGHPYGVQIRSAEGHGTTLIVTLPAKGEE